MSTYTVIATELNLHKAPKIVSNNVIARLPQFQLVTALAVPVAVLPKITECLYLRY